MPRSRTSSAKIFQAFGRVAVTIVLVVASCAAQNEAGRIRGRIIVSKSDDVTDELLRGRALTRYEMHLHGSSDPVQPYRLSEKAVVFVESVPSRETTYALPVIPPKLNQFQMLFRPLVLPVLVGTTVEFPNNDNLFHNVFSYSQSREFDLGRYPRGHTKSVRFDKPGVVKVYCDIHAYMYATILVLDNPYFTVPDDNGNFLIENVPAGSLTIGLWYDRKNVSTQTVTVQRGQTTVVNFEY